MNVIMIQMRACMVFFRDIEQETTLQNIKCGLDTNEMRKWLN